MSRSAAPYSIEVLDSDGCELSVTEETNLRLAKELAKEKIKEPGYQDWACVQILDNADVIVWDMHRGAIP